MHWTNKGPCAAVLDNNLNLIHVINVTTGQEVCVYHGHVNAIEAVYHRYFSNLAWFPDGSRIASVGTNMDLGPQNGIKTIRVWDAASAHEVIAITPLTNPSYGATVSWSPDSTKIATSCDNVISVWDAATGQSISTFDKHVDDATSNASTNLAHVTWAPDSQTIASYLDEENTIRVWDAQTGNQILVKTTTGQYGFSDLCWSSQSSLFAFASSGSTIEIWNSHNGQVLSRQVLSRGEDAFAWSPNGKRIASGSNAQIPFSSSDMLTPANLTPTNQSVLAFDVSDATTGTYLISYSYPGSEMVGWLTALSWSPDGKYIAAGFNNRQIGIWQV